MHSSKAYLHALLALPCMMLIVLIIVPMTFGPGSLGPPSGLSGLTFMFVFLLAFNVYGAVSSLHNRVLELESRHAGTDGGVAAEEK